jgi:hypothetical protein
MPPKEKLNNFEIRIPAKCVNTPDTTEVNSAPKVSQIPRHNLQQPASNEPETATVQNGKQV